MVSLTWAPQENLLWQAAAKAAKSSSVAVVFASNYSAEGSDLQTLELPGDQDQLIEAVARANPNTIVVLNTSGPASMPWLNDVAGVFEAWYPGQQDGNAIAALLYGDVDPSGHLPETFPANASQGVAQGATVLTPNAEFPGNGTDVDYTEGIDVGYRYYDVHNQTPLFPFGYGLSYTNFSYSNLRVQPSRARGDGHGHHHQHRPHDGRRGRTAVPHRPRRRRRAAVPAQGLPEGNPRPRPEPADHPPADLPGPELLPDRHQQLGSRPWPVPRQHRQQRARPTGQRAVLQPLRRNPLRSARAGRAASAARPACSAGG